jgi:hypothetical protein
MAAIHGNLVARWTVRHSGVAPLIACEGGGAHEVYSVPGLFEEVRGTRGSLEPAD